MPRFAPDNYAENLLLLAGLQVLADEAGCSPPQLAIAWLLHQAPHIIPIPGTTRVSHLTENLGAVQVVLNPAILARLDDLFHPQAALGSRYNALGNSEVDTEVF
jgi:aryl-alcohol dehydrogenase-like predicted oxidoreductase